MQKISKYFVFKTKWGWFGLAGTEFELCRTMLPVPDDGIVKSLLLGDQSGAEMDPGYLKEVQDKVLAYFEGERVEFGGDIAVCLGGFSEFTRLILEKCRQVNYGRTVTYSELAKRAGRARASRTVGHAMAVNPVPLIIPCHRIVRKDGGLGGFSAFGGVSIKKRLLEHERECGR